MSLAQWDKCQAQMLGPESFIILPEDLVGKQFSVKPSKTARIYKLTKKSHSSPASRISQG